MGCTLDLMGGIVDLAIISSFGDLGVKSLPLIITRSCPIISRGKYVLSLLLGGWET